VQAIDSSVEPKKPRETGPAKQLKGFDYLSFITQALRCKVIVQNDVLRSDLARTLRSLADPKSVPILLGLLDDPSSHVRYLAATAFAAIAGLARRKPDASLRSA
jgi:HEAT repeat protein